MKRRLPSLLILLVFSLTTISLSGCQMVRKKFGITTEVSTPEPGTPHEVVHKVMKAAMLDDADKFRSSEALPPQDYLQQG